MAKKDKKVEEIKVVSPIDKKINKLKQLIKMLEAKK
tara:strand:+ start:391 stop:498 length:108 start_codon:yes stop_codon:yes gene_type:complete